MPVFTFKRYGGYEMSSKGDRRFSAFYARLKDGRTIEEAYQLDVKGYRAFGNNIMLGKGKPPLDKSKDMWKEYLALWRKWAEENPHLFNLLKSGAFGYVFSDMFATTPVNQANALASLCNE